MKLGIHAHIEIVQLEEELNEAVIHANAECMDEQRISISSPQSLNRVQVYPACPATLIHPLSTNVDTPVLSASLCSVNGVATLPTVVPCAQLMGLPHYLLWPQSQ